MDRFIARQSMTEAEKAILAAKLRAMIDSLDHSVGEQMAVKGILLALTAAIEYGDLHLLSVVILAFCEQQSRQAKEIIAAAILGGDA